MTEVYLCAARRTPIGRYAGSLSMVRPDDLAARQPQAQWLARADWRAHDYLARLKA